MTLKNSVNQQQKREIQEIKRCWECKNAGYQWKEEREKGKRKLKYFLSYDISGKQEISYYCQNRELCGKDKNNIFKSQKN